MILDPGAVIPDSTFLIPDPTPLIPDPTYLVTTPCSSAGKKTVTKLLDHYFWTFLDAKETFSF